MIKIDLTHALLEGNVSDYQTKVTKAHELLHTKTGLGNDFLGWLDWPNNYDKEEFSRIVNLANEVKDDCEVLLVCGIGGSYLGARAAVEMIQGLYPNTNKEVIFVGNTFSSTYIKQVMKYIENKSVYLNVISKSGTTTETAMAFRIFKQLLQERYGSEECKKRIIATTDKNRGTLKELATKEGYQTFVIPDDIGGRYSVLTAVGLLPMAIMGIDIVSVMDGFKQAYDDLNTDVLEDNPSYTYAVVRRMMEDAGKDAEMLVTYELQMTMVAEWWKQLFGESEGKEGKGLLPYSGTFSTDLHSLGQFVQEGKKMLFETLLLVDKPMIDDVFPHDEENLDNMNYLEGKSLDWVNKMAQQGTLQAHVETGNVPNVILTLPDTSAYTFGYMCYFFFKACAMSVYLLEVNPFDQPGVEVYKRNMFKLLGK
ncbi:MAG: glucose-6-phosphate isomerase [Erysipelotrichaceae bacterium]